MKIDEVYRFIITISLNNTVNVKFKVGNTVCKKVNK